MAQTFKSPLKQSDSLIGTKVDIPYHKGVSGTIIDKKGDTYGVEYTGPNGITRRDRFYKNEFKSPLDQANSFAPETTRSKWNRYFKHIGDGNPRTIEKYNNLIGEIESELPFESEEQHQKWLDLGSTWNGDDEWPTLTETLLKAAEKYDLDPNHIKELKSKYKGKDYAEAIGRLKGGEAYGDIINGLVTYEK